MGYLMILTAIPGFLVSSFILILLWGVIAPKLEIVTASYHMDHVNNHNTLIYNGTTGCCSWKEERKRSVYISNSIS